MFPLEKLAALSENALRGLVCAACKCHMVDQTDEGYLFCIDCDTCGKCGRALPDTRGHADPCAPYRTTFYALPASQPEYKHHTSRNDATAYIVSKVDAGERGYAHGLLMGPNSRVADQWLKLENGKVRFEAGE